MNNPLAGTDPSGYCSVKPETSVASCANGVENGKTQDITNADGKVIGSISKDDNGNVTIKNNGSEGLALSVTFTADQMTDVNSQEKTTKSTPILGGNDSGSGENQGHQSNMNIEGFNNERYNKHDDLIISITDEINADKAGVIGTTDEQANDIEDINPRLVKAWMIQESGGNGPASQSAWDVDPLQANAYSDDWDKHKSGLGLKKSEAGGGDLKTNIRAGVIMMVRKGFGRSGQPPINRPTGTFDGFETALRRYNGRTDPTTNGNPYGVNYSNRIMRRYRDTSSRVSISLPKPL